MTIRTDGRRAPARASAMAGATPAGKAIRVAVVEQQLADLRFNQVSPVFKVAAGFLDIKCIEGAKAVPGYKYDGQQQDEQMDKKYLPEQFSLFYNHVVTFFQESDL